MHDELPSRELRVLSSMDWPILFFFLSLSSRVVRVSYLAFHIALPLVRHSTVLSLRNPSGVGRPFAICMSCCAFCCCRLLVAVFFRSVAAVMVTPMGVVIAA